MPNPILWCSGFKFHCNVIPITINLIFINILVKSSMTLTTMLNITIAAIVIRVMTYLGNQM